RASYAVPPAKTLKMPDLKPAETMDYQYLENTYEPGNCTFWVASNIKVPEDLGNANTWAVNASNEGYTVSDIPKIGAVAQTSGGWRGNVAIVKDIKDGMVLLSEMNVEGLGVTDELWYPANNYNYIYF